MPQIISIHSFRHGTGKSTFTTNLAVTLGQQGYRVGLVDTDIQGRSRLSPRSHHSSLDLDCGENRPLLQDYFLSQVSLSELVCDRSELLNPTLSDSSGYLGIIHHHFNLVHPLPPELRDVQQIHQILWDITTHLQLDYLLIDLYPGLSEETLPLIALCDIFLVLLCIDYPEFQGTAVTLDVAQRLEIPHIHLLLNQVPKTLNTPLLKQQVELTYNIPILGVLPWAEPMQTIREKEIFSLSFPNHTYSQVIQDIARHLRQFSSANTLKNKQNSSSDSGISIFELIELSPVKRQLITIMIRYTSMTWEELVNVTEQEPQKLHILLQELLEQGFIETHNINQETYYKPRLIRSKPLFKTSLFDLDNL
ncbi:MinD/ParA family protein [Spirulina subsalsa FACHB-351]|uniref:MinD/ParA family protein n=1 Tax=Spirulina subsalsa FACHB-351 TaxID=234711 RepID=A0ABT3L4J3_9CYAN|nr:MinD/ParA family protein [Spirulina subsalsa]MCW6036431.1 MinD/ParA family protein [Spirulina subsalsa FACHB-351]